MGRLIRLRFRKTVYVTRGDILIVIQKLNAFQISRIKLARTGFLRRFGFHDQVSKVFKALLNQGSSAVK